MFKPSNQVGLSGHAAGKRVKNPQTGHVVFDSGQRYLRVVDFVRADSSFTKTYPSGRKYRVAVLAWAGIDRIRYKGWDGWVHEFTQHVSYIRYEILDNQIRFTRYDNQQLGPPFDGPEDMAGTVGADPYLTCLVLDMTGYPGV